MNYDNVLEPPPDKIDITTDKKMWVIDGYRIWATSFIEALQLLPLIKSF